MITDADKDELRNTDFFSELKVDHEVSVPRGVSEYSPANR